ncbi:MAG TPA: DUF3021 family protein [Lachnospiraceae bacterium]|nr:DUF3021 family protein [Lachnospiraceae bacterium]HEX3075489.1 DUF3021 family protein [Lachnospiraceae bacterium]
MNYIKRMIQVYIRVLAGSTISSAIFIHIFYSDVNFKGAILLWQLILSAFLCSFSAFIMYTKKEPSKREKLVRVVIVYIYIISVMLGSGLLYKWVEIDNYLEILTLAVFVTVVFVCIMMSMYLKEKNLANALNKRLQVYQEARDEEGLSK